ncbi:hypothetical protein BGP77_17650 [Saccharospirillum sp. MSK14-1]|uniref:TonB-dependent receptor n=1 Tax=Saccharospirillum sp. MSK14-1 TaxID=1897632 RepID=UPI000D3B1C46|nr:TonB-dependent siderophore receptor [Saccharospirillum sp. MSK14-1]PTY38264.1 hypothetical protein BGP77_17650 [Saccharospirillum sp. MSK14-1]
MSLFSRSIHSQYLAAFSLAALPLAAMAEADSAESESSSLSAVTVIADRYDDEQPGAEYLDGQVSTGGRVGVLGQVDAYDAPFSLMRYNKELLEEQQVESLSDIASFDAGVHTYLGYGNFSEQFVLRGFHLNGDDVLYGGMYGVVPRQIVLTDIAESIEVLKGPSAFANGVSPGGSGVGGSINVEPKYAGDNETSVGLSYSNNTYLSTNIDASRRFGSDEAFGARVSAVLGQGSTSIEDEERGNISLYTGLDYETDESHTYLNVGFMRSSVDSGRPALAVGSLTSIPDAPEGDVNFKADWSDFESTNYFGILRHDQSLSDQLAVYAALGANKTREEGTYATPKLNDTDGNVTITGLDTTYESQNITAQFGLEGRVNALGLQHTLNLGYSGVIKEYGDYSEYSSGSENSNIYNPVAVNKPVNNNDSGAGSFENPELYTRTSAHGLALTDSFDVLDALINVTAGVRYQQMATENKLYDTEYDGDALSPIVGVNYHPVDSLTLYANYVEALQEGKVAPQTASNSGDNIGLVHSVQFETGAKLELGSIGGTFSLYQISQPSAYEDDSNEYGYHGEQRSRGLELNVYGDPMDRLHLLSSVAVTEAVLVETESGTNEGNRVRGVPEYRAIVGASWDILSTWTVSGRVVHTGPQAVNNENTLELDPWTRLDVGMSYDAVVKSFPVTLRANIENVTNENYWSGVGTDWGQLAIGKPINGTLSATVSF